MNIGIPLPPIDGVPIGDGVIEPMALVVAVLFTTMRSSTMRIITMRKRSAVLSHALRCS